MSKFQTIAIETNIEAKGLLRPVDSCGRMACIPRIIRKQVGVDYKGAAFDMFIVEGGLFLKALTKEEVEIRKREINQD